MHTDVRSRTQTISDLTQLTANSFGVPDLSFLLACSYENSMEVECLEFFLKVIPSLTSTLLSGITQFNYIY